MKNLIKTKLARYALTFIIGGVAGYVYFHFWGCKSGCGMKSNPYFMIGMVGLLATSFVKDKPTQQKQEE